MDYDLLEGDQYSGIYYALITFYKDKDQKQPGLNEGAARTITVTLKTELNDEWLKDSARPGYEWLRTHTNNTDMQLGEVNLKPNAEAIVTIPSITKTAEKAGTRTVNDVELPIYKYTVRVAGVTSSDLTITDTFNTNLLEVYNDKDDAFYTYCGNQYQTWQKSSGPASYVDTADGIIINTNAQSIEKDENGEYRKVYDLVYYLTVKDEAALKTIMSRATASDDGKYTMHNTAKWGDFTDGADVTYEYEGLNKEILTSDNDLKVDSEDVWAEFRITLNPGGQKLNNGDPITMTDTVKNLSVDITSIKATPSSGVTWDMTGNTVTYTIPDSTKVVITYRARVIFTDLGGTGETKKVDFSNHAEMLGYKDDINKSAERYNRGEGTAANYAINLMKYEAGDMTKPLAGAEFALYNSKDGVDKDGKPIKVIDLDNPVKDKNKKPVTFVTGTDGKIQVKGDQKELGWVLEPDTRYFLKEVKAPVGYMLADFDYSFMISRDDSTDYANYKYHNGDTMSAKDYPGTDVKVNKVWTDGNDKHNSDTVTVKLQQAKQTGVDENNDPVWGEWSDDILMEVKGADDKWSWQTVKKTLDLDKDCDWEGMFAGLPLIVPQGNDDVAVKYQVVETKVNGEDPTGTVVVTSGTEGGAYVFSISNTPEKKTGALNISKTVKLNGEATTDSRTDGTYTFEIWNADATEKVTQKADGTSIGNLTITVKDGVATPEKITVDGLSEGTYVIKETGSDNDAMMLDDSVSGYNKDLGGIVVNVTAGTDATSASTAAFANDYETTEASVKKVWVDKETTNHEPLTVQLTANGTPLDDKTVTLSSSNNWSDKISNLPKHQGGKEIAYSWVEVNLPAGYFLTNVAHNGTVTTLTNTQAEYDLMTSYTGIKSWVDDNNKFKTRPQNLKVVLYANDTPLDEEPTWEYDSATNQWTYTFINLPVFDEDGNVINYSAREEEPAGYTGKTENTLTEYEYGTISWSEVQKRITEGDKLKWNLGSLIDLSFVAIKTTGNVPTVVWTNRVPTPTEKEQIENGVLGGKLPGCNPNLVWYSGHAGTIDTGHGSLTITYNEKTMEVELTFGSSSSWSQYIYGQFNGNGKSAYDIGTTTFKNTLETTELSGSKTWVIDGTEVSADPILKLTRTVTTTGEGEDAVPTTSAPETVKVTVNSEEVDLQPVWSGTGSEKTFKYSGLPKKDSNGNEYAYSVAEYQFTYKGATYTVTKNADGTYTATPGPDSSDAPEIQVTQNGNDIVNTELKEFEFTKVWKDTEDSTVAWPTDKTITVTFNGVTEDGKKAFDNDQTLTFTSNPNELPSGWTMSLDNNKYTFKTTGLAVRKDGKELEYYVVESKVDGYKNPAYADASGSVQPNVNKATDGQQVINTPEDAVELPHTGGIGTVIFYVLGSILVIGGAIYFISRRRAMK